MLYLVSVVSPVCLSCCGVRAGLSAGWEVRGGPQSAIERWPVSSETGE